MVLDWNNEKYQKVNAAVSILLLAFIVGCMYSWYYDVLSNKVLLFMALPIGLLHWYNRKLEAVLKDHDGAQIVIDNKKLTLLKPNQDYEAIIKFRNIVSVKLSHWLFLEVINVSLKGNKEINLINFSNSKSILNKINAAL
jgi:hypothetical protein